MEGYPVHYWYVESERTACNKKGKDALPHMHGPSDVMYELVDCFFCRLTLGWPDPVAFPNLSSHPNHITNRISGKESE